MRFTVYLPVGKIKASDLHTGRRLILSTTDQHAPAASRILDVAERLAQTRGFNGFSYADIAERLAVTKASLHYHFASKAELGRALLVRYRSVFGRALADIDSRERGARAKLQGYVALYEGVAADDRVCLCGMFAAEYATLPPPMQQELRRFFDENEAWLAAVLEDGRQTGALAFRDPAPERARLLLGALEGAMLVARSYGDCNRFREAADRLLADLYDARGPAVTRTQRRGAPARAPAGNAGPRAGKRRKAR